jgi:hypothetical protein
MSSPKQGPKGAPEAALSMMDQLAITTESESAHNEKTGQQEVIHQNEDGATREAEASHGKDDKTMEEAGEKEGQEYDADDEEDPEYMEEEADNSYLYSRVSPTDLLEVLIRELANQNAIDEMRRTRKRLDDAGMSDYEQVRKLEDLFAALKSME